MKKIDYLVHVTSIPGDLIEASESKESELYRTFEIYQKLAESDLLWKVWLIDEYDALWLEVNFVNPSGEYEFHTIKIDEGTYEKVGIDDYLVLDSSD